MESVLCSSEESSSLYFSLNVRLKEKEVNENRRHGTKIENLWPQLGLEFVFALDRQ